MGAVYVATHLRLKKKVAIKLLKPEFQSSQTVVERFKREALAATQIGHENIVEILDLGETSDGHTFIVMEFLEGEDLSARIQKTGALKEEDACALMVQILSPIGAAHKSGIVHRDLKPENIFLAKRSRDEIVKVLDFGVSRMSEGDTDLKLTQTGLVLGTPYYMSPEQAQGAPDIDQKTDIYALGVILYELLAGVVPCQSTNYNSLMYKVLTGDYPPLSSFRPDIDVGLVEVVKKAMSLDRKTRFQDTEAFEKALTPYAGDTSKHFKASVPSLRSSTADLYLATDPTMEEDVYSNTMVAPTKHLLGTQDPNTFVAPNHSPKAKIAFAAAFAILLAGGLGYILKSGPSNAEKSEKSLIENGPTTQIPKTQQVVKQTPPVQPPKDDVVKAASKIAVSIKTVPSRATLKLDGKTIGARDLQFATSDDFFELSISHPGFETQKVSYQKTQDLDLNFELIKSEKKPQTNRKNNAKNPKRIRHNKRDKAPDQNIIKSSPYD